MNRDIPPIAKHFAIYMASDSEKKPNKKSVKNSFVKKVKRIFFHFLKNRKDGRSIFMFKFQLFEKQITNA